MGVAYTGFGEIGREAGRGDCLVVSCSVLQAVSVSLELRSF